MTDQKLDEIIRLLKDIFQELKGIKSEIEDVEMNTSEIVDLLRK